MRCTIFKYWFSGDVVREEKEKKKKKKTKEDKERFSKRLGSEIGKKRESLVLLTR